MGLSCLVAATERKFAVCVAEGDVPEVHVYICHVQQLVGLPQSGTRRLLLLLLILLLMFFLPVLALYRALQDVLHNLVDIDTLIMLATELEQRTGAQRVEKTLLELLNDNGRELLDGTLTNGGGRKMQLFANENHEILDHCRQTRCVLGVDVRENVFASTTDQARFLFPFHRIKKGVFLFIIIIIFGKEAFSLG